MVYPGLRRPSLESCRVHQACHVDVPHNVVAIAEEDILVGARDRGNETCREARTASREGRSDSMRLYLDLQVHPR